MKILIVFCLLLSGCSLFRTKPDVSPLPPKASVRAEQEKILQEADAEFEKKNYKLSLEKFESFVQKYPQSIFFAQANLGVAQSYLSLGAWEKAVTSFRTVINFTRTKQPEISAKSLYSSAYCYEMLGNDVRLLATLKDAEALSAYLPEDIRLAELPARLASVYYKLGRELQADRYFQIADRGMSQLRAQEAGKLSKAWIAKTYFQMGGLTSSQLSSENLRSHMESLAKMQVFTLKAIEENGEPWSQRALDNLRRNYMDIWNTIQSWPKESNLDPVAGHKRQVQNQAQLYTDLLTTMERFRTFVAPESQEKNQKVGELLAYLNEMEIKAREFIMNSGVYNDLTPDAKKRQGPRIEGLIRDEK